MYLYVYYWIVHMVIPSLQDVNGVYTLATLKGRNCTTCQEVVAALDLSATYPRRHTCMCLHMALEIPASSDSQIQDNIGMWFVTGPQLVFLHTPIVQRGCDIRFVWFYQFHCCSGRICRFFEHYPPRSGAGPTAITAIAEQSYTPHVHVNVYNAHVRV